MSKKVTGACVPIEYLVLGPIENNVYLIGDDDALIVVDPTCRPDFIMQAVGARKVDAIVLTHAHWDHVGAAKDLRDATGARVVASSVDAPFINGERKLDPSHRRFDPCPIDVAVSDGETVMLGSRRWEVMVTPGHTPGSMCLFHDSRGQGESEVEGAPSASDAPDAPVLIAGDTLFAGAHGRTDFVGGDPRAMRESLSRLAQLPDDTLVLPGHNSLTTIGREKLWIR